MRLSTENVDLAFGSTLSSSPDKKSIDHTINTHEKSAKIKILVN